MTGKGWTWLGSDGASSTIFKRAQNLRRSMQGMVGFRPKAGSGKLFNSVFSELLLMNPSASKEVSKQNVLLDSQMGNSEIEGTRVNVTGHHC